MRSIPPLDLTQQYRTIQAEVEASVHQVLSSGRYIGGDEVQAFEKAFAAYIGAEHCLGCNSGTDALYLALRAIDIQPGDEVITTPFTFFATSEVINRVGAIPIFVDIDPSSLNFDLDQVESAISPQTRAIVPVHLFGHPVDMSRLAQIAQAHELFLIEDCAQAIGADWNGQKVGSFGDMGCFSFFPTKNLGACGDGGAVVTSRPELAQRIRQLREHGSPQRYYHTELGLNSRLDAIQACILRVKLNYLDQWNSDRSRIADRYQRGLGDLAALQLPQANPQGSSVWHQYTMRVKSWGDKSLGDKSSSQPAQSQPAQSQPTQSQAAQSQATQNDRDELKAKLATFGVQTMIYYPVPLHLQAVYQTAPCRFSSLPVVEQVAQQVLSLPMFPELSGDQQDYVIQALRTILEN